MATILITGATGFVGRALVRNLLETGHRDKDLRLLVRDPARAAELGVPASSLVVGDLLDRAALARAVAGADCVFHIAGVLKALSWGEFRSVNRDGTRHLVAALAAGAPEARLIHVSSVAAAGPSVDGAATTLPPSSCRPVSNYGESKRLGELEAERHGGAWLIVRPPIVYGAGDAATRLLFRQATARVTVVPWTPRLLSLIHVRDLVTALRKAADVSASRRVVPVEGPDRLTTDELMCAIAEACGRRARLLRVPLLLARPAAWGAELWARVVRRPGTFNADKLRELRQRGWVADGTVQREVLDFVPGVPARLGLAEVARAEGFAPGAGA